MSDVYQALQDVKWLSDRLKGLISLSEEIESYDTLKKQASDFALTIEKKKDEYNNVMSDFNNLKEERTRLKDSFEQAKKDQKAELDGLLAKAQQGANDLMTKAKNDAELLRRALEDERKAYQIKNKTLEETSMSLTQEITSKGKQLEGLKASIEQLKAKF